MALKLPTLIKTNTGWTLDGFVPASAAYDWPKYERSNGTLYILQCGDFLKIGITRDVAKRIAQLDAANPLPVTLIAKRTISLAGLPWAEAWMHQRFAAELLKNEWFAVGIEDVIDALPEAERFARAYARCCRDWYQRQRVREINSAL